MNSDKVLFEVAFAMVFRELLHIKHNARRITPKIAKLAKLLRR
jgi:hypothetical protein